MQLAYLIMICFIVVNNGVNSQDSADTCPCSAKLDCPPKYQVIPGHTACLAKSSIASASGVSEDLKKQIVDRHNEVRRKAKPLAVNMLKMTWDDELAMIAQRWTDACLMDNKGKFYHDSIRYIPGRFSVNQNLGMGHTSFNQVMTAWSDEDFYYNMMFGQPIGSMLDLVGHYTQMVWASTNKIGCGYTLCKKRTFYVCNYAPSGNIMPFNKPYKNGTTKCADCLKCDNGLCDCGNLECANGGTLDPKTCTCKCYNSPVNKGPNCHVDCSAKDLSSCASAKTASCSTCPHKCKLCSCLDKTDRNGKCTGVSQGRTSDFSSHPMLFPVFASYYFDLY